MLLFDYAKTWLNLLIERNLENCTFIMIFIPQKGCTQVKDRLVCIRVTGQKKPGHVSPGHLPQGHIPPGHLPPGHLPPRTYTPQDIYPTDFKMPYLVHASCVDYIMHFKKHLFCRNSIYL